MVTPSANAGAAKQKVSSFVPAANLLDDSAGSLSYGIPKEALNVLPNLIQWIETNQAITDFGISHTTLEEVFIALARPTTEEATVATATAVAVDESTVAIVEGKTKDPNTTVTVATATATATAIPTGAASAASELSEEENKILNYKRIPTTTKQKMKALCYQRTIARKRHQKYNVCLCLCPAIAMLILFG